MRRARRSRGALCYVHTLADLIMTISSQGDLAGLRRVGAVVAETLQAMEAAARPGVRTAELDAVAERVFRRHGARSAPQVAYDFPGETCISVNEQVVHGIPGDRMIEPRDVVKLDVTAELDGFIADAAVTVLIPPAQPAGRRLRTCARRAFERALRLIEPGLPVAELGRAVEEEVRRFGCAVMRELRGHGVGRAIHEAPSIPNYYSPLTEGVLHEGLVIALEPIVSESPARVVEEEDGWTLRTHNRTLTAHYEHTVVITARGAEVVTARAA
jgi:methionyl aminopeptidase